MGDQDTQTQQERSWWAADGSPEDFASSPAFDEPLEWPDATAWEQLFEGGPPTQPAYVPEDFGAGLLFPEAAPVEDGGGGRPTEAHLEPLPQSIWAPDPSGDDQTDSARTAATVAALGGSGTAVAVPTPVAETETRPHGHRAGPAWLQRFHIRHGSAAVVALACCVSLVLLGMFLSVRARDNLPTQTSDFQPAGGEIVTQASTSVPPPTTAPPTTASPPSSISLSYLIPADAADGSGTGGTTARTTAPATTAAPSRSAAPSGGSGGGSGSGQQPTNTTAAPDPEPTTPPATSPPPDDTTTTPTTARRINPTIPDYTIPTFTVPTWPPATSGTQPGFRTTGN